MLTDRVKYCRKCGTLLIREIVDSVYYSQETGDKLKKAYVYCPNRKTAMAERYSTVKHTDITEDIEP